MKLTVSCAPEALKTSMVRHQSDADEVLAPETVAESRACPVCGNAGTEKWLTGSDRFEQRKQSYDLLHCKSCSMVWLDNPPSLEEMAAHYTRHYYRVITAGGEGCSNRWEKHARTIARYKETGSLLDLGCSSGAFLSTMKRGDWELYGVEISESSAQQAHNRTGAHVFVGDVQDAPFSPESFDVITSFDVLEHLYQPREVMKRVSQWLKPGGIFLVAIPNIQSWEAQVFRSYWYGLELPRHLSHFSPASLGCLATSVGLKIEELTTPRAHYIEYSMHYVVDDLLQRLGISRFPLEPSAADIPWKVVRKLLHLAVFSPMAAAACAATAGPVIEAVFRKK